MAIGVELPNRSFRQRVAASTPRGLRTAVRLALNYIYRLRIWRDLLGELGASDGHSRLILWLSVLAAPFTALRKLDSFQTPYLLGDTSVTVQGVGRFNVRAKTDDLLHVMASREPWLSKLLAAELAPGRSFVDGGANIGFYSLLAARLVGPSGQVVAFEMMPDTAAILRKHIERNGDLPIRIVERALSEKSGERVMASVEPGLHGQASIVSKGRGPRQSVSVETVTLDEALAAVERVDLLKLDLEGAEFGALCGAQAVLARTGCVVFESNDEDPRIFALLEAAGFAVERLGAFDFVARPVAGLGMGTAA